MYYLSGNSLIMRRRRICACEYDEKFQCVPMDKYPHACMTFQGCVCVPAGIHSCFCAHTVHDECVICVSKSAPEKTCPPLLYAVQRKKHLEAKRCYLINESVSPEVALCP